MSKMYDVIDPLIYVNDVPRKLSSVLTQTGRLINEPNDYAGVTAKEPSANAKVIVDDARKMLLDDKVARFAQEHLRFAHYGSLEKRLLEYVSGTATARAKEIAEEYTQKALLGELNEWFKTVKQTEFFLGLDAFHKEGINVEGVSFDVASSRNFLLSNFQLISSDLMVERQRDWSGVRSKGRATRRLARGHRQNIRTIYVPQKTVIVDQKRRTIIGHPSTINALVKHIKMKEAV